VRNLTRVEAERRAALVDVRSYDVHLDLRPTLEGSRFASTTEVRFACREPGASTFVELDGEPSEVLLNGRPVTARSGNRIALDDLADENVLRVVATCSTSRSGEGLHRFVDPADGAVYLYAQAFLDDCQRLFACFDQPDLKAVLRLTVDAPPGWTVVANTRGTRDGDRWAFEETARLSTYLFTVAAGPYAGLRSWHGDVELGLWCRQSLAEHLLTDAESGELLEVTGQAMDLQQSLFGRRYPFGDTYDQLFVPEFNAGAMENPGAVTFTEQLVFRGRATQARRRTRAMVVAHELSHMWFGDLVTMRWWDDLWLNESFAELMGYLTVDRATRFEQTWVDFCTSRKAWGYRADALPTTHPVAGSAQDARSALLDFDGISYAKGASVLRQLMATIGEDAFFAGVRDHFEAHAFGNAVLADLLAAFERAAGRDLQDWARRWLRTPGTSVLRVVGEELQQEPPAEHPVWREHRTGVGLYARSGERLTRTVRLDVVVGGVPVPLDGAAAADLVLPNDDDRTFAVVRLDAASLEVLLEGLGTLDDPLARAVGWSSLWHAVRDAGLPAARFVDAVLAHVGAESDPGVAETLLLQARTAAALYDADPEPLLARISDACWDAAAALGGDLQLARVRAAVAAAVPAQSGRLAGLLAGDVAVPGLVLDVDLRWLLVQRLAACGAPVDVAAELARDPSAAGRLAGLTAEASRPDEVAKSEAFGRAVDDESLSSHEAQALAAGLWQPLHADLCRPFVARYVDAVPRLWTSRTPAAAQALTAALFPSTLPEPEVLQAVDGLLAGELHPAARRVVVEQRHDLARAVRARQA
jgi:aminopeptidase N